MLTYLSLGRMGRFANGMFEIAGTIGIAVKSQQSFAFPLWVNHDAVERFGSKEDTAIHKYFVNALPLVPEDLSFQDHPYFWGYRDVQLAQGNWNLQAHFQSEKYFRHCMKLIRHYFTMYNEISYDATAVHMRWGDYDNSYHPTPNIEYYRKALEHVSRETILLFSDDLEQSHKMMTEIGVKYCPIEKDYLESFKIMKCCKHFVCGNSSYSLMAAILSDHPDKIVTAPAKWFGDHVGLETVDLYPENCIII